MPKLKTINVVQVDRGTTLDGDGDYAAEPVVRVFSWADTPEGYDEAENIFRGTVQEISIRNISGPGLDQCVRARIYEEDGRVVQLIFSE